MILQPKEGPTMRVVTEAPSQPEAARLVGYQGTQSNTTAARLRGTIPAPTFFVGLQFGPNRKSLVCPCISSCK